jgi:hypothetical protein
MASPVATPNDALREGARHDRWRAHRALALVVVACALVHACGSSPAAAPSSGDTSPEATGPEVVFIGDSMMGELVPAISEAFEGTVQTRYVVTTTIGDEPLETWREMLAEHTPDVVVVLVGTWERMIDVDAHLEPGWPQSYTRRVEPFLDLMSDAGTEVLWLGYPPMAWEDGPEGTAQVAAMNDAYATLPALDPGVTYLDAGATLGGYLGESVRSYVDEQGEEVVLRVTDQHMCPAGVERMARPVIADLMQRLDVAPAAAWELGAWRHEPGNFQHPEECPDLASASD